MSVTFKSEQRYLQVSHEHLFHCGAIEVPKKPQKMAHYESGIEYEVVVADVEACKEMGIPAPEHLGGYHFVEGEDHNLLTLDTDEEIEAMRAYAATTDNAVVELDEDGIDLLEKEENDLENNAVVFISRDFPHYRLTPAIYKKRTDAEGKTFVFNRGIKRDLYIPQDTDELQILRNYAKECDNSIKELSGLGLRRYRANASSI